MYEDGLPPLTSCLLHVGARVLLTPEGRRRVSEQGSIAAARLTPDCFTTVDDADGDYLQGIGLRTLDDGAVAGCKDGVGDREAGRDDTNNTDV